MNIATFILLDLKNKRREFAQINDILKPGTPTISTAEQDACLTYLTNLEEEIDQREARLAILIQSHIYPGH